jgi:alpha-L-fucosidase 2
MILQSHAGELHLLPALPDAWPDGRVRGLCARGGFTVDVEWRGGKLDACTIRGVNGSNCQVRYGDDVVAVRIAPGQTARLNGKLQRIS